MTHLLAGGLGQAGWVVVSGLARGIDTIAHKTALTTGTIAVIAGGIDSIYPPENKNLYQEIGEKGVIVAELPLGTSPRAHHFPQRNRIIAGMSLGTVVVEATLKSGSLITARMALEYNREVFAVPGSPLDARSHGPNSLIKQGALLTESVNDVIQALDYASYSNSIRVMPSIPTEPLLPISDMPLKEQELHRQILISISPHPTATNDVIARVGLPTAHVTTALLELELAGMIQRYPGNKVARIASL
jgi:DNA processing protein